ncbi:SLC13 family permease [Desulfofustis glycolicus]|uniref:Di-and tricarboxylate transporter n=1 Tax=Desulfofustis glycolicus DSM 9705 TaxID=1121409 RepID=A0A1M5YHZ1_9BACT|nr:SLC13 family permease [Desulfofustis glycolicus]MCB2214811.1 SLC13 family permease [Desulfobulbaceae bacterium]SHI11626.1 Di-and tricarboxylate transporter [Desulfofustis glycolicus DSM 9705]
MDVWIISVILVVVLYLLVTETISVDLTAIGIMVVLVVSGLLAPGEAVSGLANPALVTVAAMFVVSRGLMRTGGVEFLGRQVIKVARKNLTAALALILVSVGFASAFINNTPIVMLFIPVVMAMCCDLGLSPSKFLIPVSYASILAGTCTLIGTSTNIIVSDLSAQHGYGALSMFELSLVGVPIAVAGMVFLIVAAPRLLPSLANPICQMQDSEHRKYLAELQIRAASQLIGQQPRHAFQERFPALEVIELTSHDRIYYPMRDDKSIEEDDILLVKGSLNDLVAILHEDGVELPSSEKGLTLGAQKDPPIIFELLIAPGSSLLGRRLARTELARDTAINIIAVKRQGARLAEKQIHDVRLKTGDILLIWCSGTKLEELRSERDYLIIEDVYEEIVHKRKAWWAIINFVAMIGTAALGLADIMTCALTAAFLMIVTGCLQMRDAYRALQADVLLLIAGTIALGLAMEKSGASSLYADLFLTLLSDMPTIVVLGGVIALTSISTQILSNNAAAVLLLPIAISTALGVGADPKPFIIGVCIGASACFASPLGYQTNLMVFGPGGYRFFDYLRLGIPLNLLVVIAGTILIPLIWPF